MTEGGGETELRIRSLAAGGAGVGELPDGRVCFVHRTAPGDRVRVRLTTEKPRWARAELLEVLERGPDRRPAPCPLYPTCGGCTLQHLAYRAQLEAKARIVTDALDRIGGVPHPPVGPARPSPSEVRYRSRVSFHLRRLRGERVVAGFHELERPGRILDVDGRCLLPEPPVVRCWDALRAAWGPGARKLPGGRGLRLTLRAVLTGVVLAVEPESVGGGAPPSSSHPDPGRPEELVEEVEGLTAVWWGPAGGEPELLAGDPDVREGWEGRAVRTRGRAFLQVNRPGAAVLHQAVLPTLGDPRGRRFVDAYCGVGTWGRGIARAGGTAVGIERDPAAVAAAREGAPDGFTVLSGHVEERLEEALPADVVILNPPRSGLEESVPARLRASGVERVVYVSCDPATLARDLGRLGGAYRITALEAFDLFPQTAHVEVLAVLHRTPEGSPCATT